MDRSSVIILGSDPAYPRGGVAVAVGGFAHVLRERDLLAACIPSHRAGTWNRTWWPAARAIPNLVTTLREVNERGSRPIVFGHAGGLLGVARQAGLLSIARRMGALTILQVHSVKAGQALADRRTRRSMRLLLDSADVVGVLSSYWKQRFRDSGVTTPIAVIPNPLPPDMLEFATRPTLREAIPPLRCLTMSHLVPGKGIDLAIRAMDHAPEGTRLTVAGTGPLHSELEALARARPGVELVGWVDGEQKRRLFAESDVFVLPTTYDSFGMGFLEAACHAIPSVAVSWPPVAEVVLHGETGLLVDTSPSEIGHALHMLADPELRESLGERARQRALERYGPDAIVQAIRSAVALIDADR